jgi:hypothetical protein
MTGATPPHAVISTLSDLGWRGEGARAEFFEDGQLMRYDSLFERVQS